MKRKQVLVCCASAIALLSEPCWSQVTTRVSVSSLGEQANGESAAGPISADRRFIAFISTASDLVPGDTNGSYDVFVRDLQKWTTERVSVSSAGAQAQGASQGPSISADGRYVVFTSTAANLVAGDSNGVEDTFVHERSTHTTTRVSVSSSGEQANQASPGRTSISGDGRYIAFKSNATNLVVGDTNGSPDIFVYDQQNHTTTRVSVDSSGTQANWSSDQPAISADGRYVAFASDAWNLVPGDVYTGGWTDIFVHDMSSGATTRVSVSSTGVPSNSFNNSPCISADGRFVLFSSWAGNLVAGDTNGLTDAFMHDRSTGTTILVTVDSHGGQGDNYSYGTGMSADGRFVAFSSWATNLVANDTNDRPDVFVRDIVNATTERVSVSSSGAQADLDCSGVISPDGHYVAFSSWSSNLVAGDTNGVADVFVRDLFGCTPGIYCTAKVNSAGCTPAIHSSGSPSASAGSGFVVSAEQVLDQQAGLLFYSVHGQNGAPFLGGFLCAMPPTKRTPHQTAGTTGSLPCTGIYTFDFNAYIASGIDPTLELGRQVWAQYWMRDAASPSGTGLTDALTFAICQ